MKQKGAKLLFNQAVDPKAQGLPDYREVVQRPRDLGTIYAALEACKASSFVQGPYTSPAEVFQDVDLVWANCMAYNNRPEDAGTRELAAEVQAAWCRKWRTAGLLEDVTIPPKAGWAQEAKLPPSVTIKRSAPLVSDHRQRPAAVCDKGTLRPSKYSASALLSTALPELAACWCPCLESVQVIGPTLAQSVRLCQAWSRTLATELEWLKALVYRGSRLAVLLPGLLQRAGPSQRRPGALGGADHKRGGAARVPHLSCRRQRQRCVAVHESVPLTVEPTSLPVVTLQACMVTLPAAELGVGSTYIQTTAMLDWVVEVGKLPCIWAVTQHAWYEPSMRCVPRWSGAATHIDMNSR